MVFKVDGGTDTVRRVIEQEEILTAGGLRCDTRLPLKYTISSDCHCISGTLLNVASFVV